MKSIYDFMSKICPSAPLKLSHRPPEQTWSGWFVGERSCSCSLQRGALELLALKSRFPSHSPLPEPRDGLEWEEHLGSLLHGSPWDAWPWEGREVLAGGCCLCCCSCCSCAGPEQHSGSQEGFTYPARTTEEGQLCQGKGRGTLQHHSWVVRAALIICIITLPWIQCAASWGWWQMHTLSLDFGGNNPWLFHKSELSK